MERACTCLQPADQRLDAGGFPLMHTWEQRGADLHWIQEDLWVSAAGFHPSSNSRFRTEPQFLQNQTKRVLSIVSGFTQPCWLCEAGTPGVCGFGCIKEEEHGFKSKVLMESFFFAFVRPLSPHCAHRPGWAFCTFTFSSGSFTPPSSWSTGILHKNLEAGADLGSFWVRGHSVHRGAESLFNILPHKSPVLFRRLQKFTTLQ